MAQVVNRSDWLQRTGAGIGEALGQGLTRIAQNKLSDLQTRNAKQERLKALTGTGALSKEQAEFISALPEKDQWEASQLLSQNREPEKRELHEHTKDHLREAGIPDHEIDDFHEHLQQNKPEMPEYKPQNISDIMQQSLGQRAPLNLQEALQKITPQQQAEQELGPKTRAALEQQPIEQPKQKMTQEEHREKAMEARRAPLGLTKEQRAAERADRAFKQKEEAANRARLDAQQARADVETKKYFEDVNREKAQADFSEPRLKDMRKIINKGGLPTAAAYKILKKLEDMNPLTSAAIGTGIGTALRGEAATAGAGTGATLGSTFGPIGTVIGGIGGALAGAGGAAAIGGAIGSVISPMATLLHNGLKSTFNVNEEKFAKLSTGFLRGAKELFGARMTDNDLNTYLESIPTLAQTDAGKLAVIDDMELFNKAAKIKYRAMRDVIRDNNGKRPFDLQEQVDERTRRQLDKLSDIFKEDL